MKEQQPQVYRKFLQEILQVTAVSNGDAQTVHPLLAANMDILNENFLEVLHSWAANALTNVQSHEVRFIGEVISNFSNLVYQFPLGNKAKNIEIAIAGYEITLNVYARSAFPQEWAKAQNNLAAAYNNRILGERGENIEKAIAAYFAALEVYNSSDFPQDWAITQNNLGNTYAERISGERGENIEKAIAAYSAALVVYNSSDYPQEWAITQNNLAAAYNNRILGERGENIEKAIAAYSAALEIYNSNDFLQDWAMTQHYLGNAYAERISGERGENIEKAIAAYSAALEIYNSNDFPQDWAMTQHYLGNAYAERISGERGENIEKAIAAYSAALEIYNSNDFPPDWAMTQHYLGNAYAERISGERGENIEKAIAAYSAALEVYTRSTFAQEWAMTQNRLATAYHNRISGERGQNIEKAIAAYSAALEVYTKNAFPQDWAMTQNNLGDAYANRIFGERGENIEKAIAAYSAALEVYNSRDFPQEWAMTQNNLGNAYANRIFGERGENIEKASAAYSAALEVYTKSAFPQDWVTTQNNLGNAYFDIIFGEPAENIENESAVDSTNIENESAVNFVNLKNDSDIDSANIENDSAVNFVNIENSSATFFDALEVYTRNTIPQNGKTKQNYLDNPYSDTIFGERADKIENGSTAYFDALKDSSISPKPSVKLYAPNIHLFAFQLDNSSSFDDDDLSINKNLIWENGDEVIRKTLHQNLHLSQHLDVNKEPDSPRADLLKDTDVIGDDYTISFAGKVPFEPNQDLLIKGFVRPLRIDNSYSLWLNLRRPEQEDDNPTPDVDISFLRQLNHNNCLTFQKSSPFIGQTLLITGWLTRAKDKKNVKQIAEECLTAIFPDNHKLPSFNSQGELFGSPIFEYGLFSQLANYQHVLIWLFADGEADNKFNQCHQEVLDLFLFRTKAVKAFKDSREVYKQLDLAYRQIETTIVKVPKLDKQLSLSAANLADFKNQIQSLLQLALTYTRLLRNLEDSQNRIAINSYNYGERLQQISGMLPDEDISFLETFSQKNCPFFQQQINAELAYFRYGSDLLSRAIDSIRAIVEIEQVADFDLSLKRVEKEQAERARSLEKVEIEQIECIRSLKRVEREQAERARSLEKIAIEQAEYARSLDSTIYALGISFGGGAIISSIVTQHIDKINQPIPFISPNNPPNPFYVSLILNLIFTFGFMALGWLITKGKHYPKNRKLQDTKENQPGASGFDELPSAKTNAVRTD
jgi:tetratricopeptide (TPR) repeat protein